VALAAYRKGGNHRPNKAALGQSSRKRKTKGNIANSGERIYHLPGGAFYDRTKIDQSAGERWFCSEQEAQVAGWRRSMR
jgi:hypothetical protein